MAVRVPLADPPPCTIKVQQVVVVSELFKAPKAPRVGDTLDIQLDLNVDSKAKDAAQAAINTVTNKGKTVLSVTMRAKVFQVDDLGALVVYAQVTGITVNAKGYSLGVGLADGSGAKLALPVVLP
jgi:flagellar basal body L-ring protein FlgH